VVWRGGRWECHAWVIAGQTSNMHSLGSHTHTHTHTRSLIAPTFFVSLRERDSWLGREYPIAQGDGIDSRQA
jgi:hypothetical protein